MLANTATSMPRPTSCRAEGRFYDFAMLSLLYNMRIFDILLMN